MMPVTNICKRRGSFQTPPKCNPTKPVKVLHDTANEVDSNTSAMETDSRSETAHLKCLTVRAPQHIPAGRVKGGVSHMMPVLSVVAHRNISRKPIPGSILPNRSTKPVQVLHVANTVTDVDNNTTVMWEDIITPPKCSPTSHVQVLHVANTVTDVDNNTTVMTEDSIPTPKCSHTSLVQQLHDANTVTDVDNNTTVMQEDCITQPKCSPTSPVQVLHVANTVTDDDNNTTVMTEDSIPTPKCSPTSPVQVLHDANTVTDVDNNTTVMQEDSITLPKCSPTSLVQQLHVANTVTDVDNNTTVMTEDSIPTPKCSPTSPVQQLHVANTVTDVDNNTTVMTEDSINPPKCSPTSPVQVLHDANTVTDVDNNPSVIAEDIITPPKCKPTMPVQVLHVANTVTDVNHNISALTKESKTPPKYSPIKPIKPMPVSTLPKRSANLSHRDRQESSGLFQHQQPDLNNSSVNHKNASKSTLSVKLNNNKKITTEYFILISKKWKRLGKGSRTKNASKGTASVKLDNNKKITTEDFRLISQKWKRLGKSSQTKNVDKGTASVKSYKSTKNPPEKFQRFGENAQTNHLKCWTVRAPQPFPASRITGEVSHMMPVLSVAARRSTLRKPMPGSTLQNSSIKLDHRCREELSGPFKHRRLDLNNNSKTTKITSKVSASVKLVNNKKITTEFISKKWKRLGKCHSQAKNPPVKLDCNKKIITTEYFQLISKKWKRLGKSHSQIKNVTKGTASVKSYKYLDIPTDNSNNTPEKFKRFGDSHSQTTHRKCWTVRAAQCIPDGRVRVVVSHMMPVLIVAARRNKYRKPIPGSPLPNRFKKLAQGLREESSGPFYHKQPDLNNSSDCTNVMSKGTTPVKSINNKKQTTDSTRRFGFQQPDLNNSPQNTENASRRTASMNSNNNKEKTSDNSKTTLEKSQRFEFQQPDLNNSSKDIKNASKGTTASVKFVKNKDKTTGSSKNTSEEGILKSSRRSTSGDNKSMVEETRDKGRTRSTSPLRESVKKLKTKILKGDKSTGFAGIDIIRTVTMEIAGEPVVVNLMPEVEDEDEPLEIDERLTPENYSETVRYYELETESRRVLIRGLYVLGDMLLMGKLEGDSELWKVYLIESEVENIAWQEKCKRSNAYFQKTKKVLGDDVAFYVRLFRFLRKRSRNFFQMHPCPCYHRGSGYEVRSEHRGPKNKCWITEKIETLVHLLTAWVETVKPPLTEKIDTLFHALTSLFETVKSKFGDITLETFTPSETSLVSVSHCKIL